MKTSDVEILIVPGSQSSGEDHWQTRWQRSLKTARRVEQSNWLHPDRDTWVGTLISTIAKSETDLPIVLVAHSLGVATAVHAMHELPSAAIAGAFLVAPADVDNSATWPARAGYTLGSSTHGFSPLPNKPLSCPAALVASTNDPYCSALRAKELARVWGASYIEAGPMGHINAASGHGPWPEGLMQFGWFLKKVGQSLAPARTS